jgi:hypothetical protein
VRKSESEAVFIVQIKKKTNHNTTSEKFGSMMKAKVGRTPINQKLQNNKKYVFF